MGCFFKLTNAYGAISGASVGFIFGIWLSIGSFIVDPKYPKLDVSIAGCNDSVPYNSSDIFSTFHKLNNTHAYNVDGFSFFYSISYMLYATSGVTITVIVWSYC